tara:strand:+ start:905 stop:1072 length:168 start_codon:yes stop_codon:yes gene_type:complete
MFTFLSLVVVLHNAERIGKAAAIIGCTIVASQAVSEAAYYMAQARAAKNGVELDD